jgi:hypothetical protein
MTIGLGDLIEAALESRGVIELHGTLTVNGKTWTGP